MSWPSGPVSEEGAKWAVPPLHVVATDRVAGRVDLAAAGGELLAACGPELALHLRLREACGRELFSLARRLAGDARRHGGWCVVNERVDVALAARAQAVQLGSGALPLATALELSERTDGPLAAGASVHAPEEAREAAGRGANYLLLGTIFATPSHPGRPGAGPELIAACRDLELPLIAIGGVNLQRLPDVVKAGAHGAAVVRAVWEADDPVASARELAAALTDG